MAKARLRHLWDFFVDRNSVRLVNPRQHRAMQRLEAALVKEQAAAIHFLVRLVDRHQPGFVHVVNRLSRPKKEDRPATTEALRKLLAVAKAAEDARRTHRECVPGSGMTAIREVAANYAALDALLKAAKGTK